MSLDQKPLSTAFGFVHIPEEHRAWTGSAEELAELANAEIRKSSGVDPELNERLVRYYVSMGAIDRPLRVGREARFGFRHFAQLMVARSLLSRGLSLGNVRHMVQEIQWDAIIGDQTGFAACEVPMDASPPTAAQLLVQSFMKEMPRRALSPGYGAARASAPAGAQSLVEMPLAGGTRVLLTEQTLRALTPQSANELADELRAALLAAVAQHGKGSQP
jgi:DNA-binding transcriptional MerR regulator